MSPTDSHSTHGGHYERGHAHGHAHGDDERMFESLLLQDRVLAPLMTEIAGWLGVARGMRILDAGCGAGGMTVEFGRRGATVEAVDPGERQREATIALVEAAGLDGLVNVGPADVTALEYPDNTFDLVWCSRVLHHVEDMGAGARELARVLRPGGRLVIREGGFTFRVLPDDIGVGEPHLEDRLAAAGVGRFVRTRDLSEAVPYPFGWPQLLRDAGLVDLTARTFTTDSLSPLSSDEEEWVLRNWTRWLEGEEMRARIPAADLPVLERLADRTAAEWAFGRTDLHLRMGHSVYVGVKPN